MAHELTPTYPELRSSYIPGVLTTKLKMWNARMDVDYYKIEVTDENWNAVPFITTEEIFLLHILNSVKSKYFFQVTHPPATYVPGQC